MSRKVKKRNDEAGVPVDTVAQRAPLSASLKSDDTPSAKSGSRSRRRARNIGISILVLVMLLMIAGVVYTWHADSKGVPVDVKASSATSFSSEPIQPSKPRATAPEGVALQSFLSPVHPGDETSLYISTNATSTCSVSVLYNNVASTDPALAPKKADDYGSVSWDWTVSKSAPRGDWPVTVTCTYNGSTGVFKAMLSII